MVRAIGADHVIEYSEVDFTRSGHHYDLILDTAGNCSLSDCKRALSSSGILVAVGGPVQGDWLGPLTFMLKLLLASLVGSKKMVPMLAKASKK